MIEQKHLSFVFDQLLYRIPETIAYESKPVQVISQDKKSNTEAEGLFVAKTQKNIWIFIHPERENTISENEIETMNKILIALKLNINDVSIFVPEELFHSLFTTINFNDKIIIDFGVNPINIISKPLETNKINKINNSTYLSTHRLSILQKNQSQKIAWWNLMKSIFSN